MKPYFSLIIPYHNPKINDVIRLFDSLYYQDINNDDLEIIVVDDNSDNKEEYQTIIKNTGLNIIFVDTDTDIHCPGNTRRAGMNHINGDWLFFCDQDDYFEKHVLLVIMKILETFPKKPSILSTGMFSYNQEENKYSKNYSHKQAWLHGKFYNYNDFISKYDINFKKDLKTHEDVYFNSLCASKMKNPDKEIISIDIKTYRWVENPDSLTRKATNDRGYFFENFNDYIIAASEPFWNNEINPEVANNQLMMTILHCYFYYEAASYYNGPYDFKDTLQYIIEYIKKLLNHNYSSDDIVNYIYKDPIKYDLVMKDCEIIVGKFIPKTSFRDFIYRLEEKINGSITG